MRHNRSRFVQIATAMAVAIVALATSPAAAQKSSKPPQPASPTTRVLPFDASKPRATINSWALAPSGDQPGQPGTRPNLSYELAPGTEVKDAVILLNYSNVPLTFRVYSTDAYNNFDGQFDLLTGDKAPVDAGSWVKVPQANITIPPLASANLPITIAVPPDATPGDHAAAILASSQAEGSGPDGKVITLDRRTGSRLYVRVAGPLSPKLEIEKIKGTYRSSLNPLSGSLDVTYTVRNRGNVRLAAKQQLALRAPLGIGIDKITPVDMPELLPGNSVTLKATFKGVPALLFLSTKITLSPQSAPNAVDPKTAGTARTGYSLAIPWTLLALALAVGLGLYSRRSYLRHQDEAAEGYDPEADPESDLVLVP